MAAANVRIMPAGTSSLTEVLEGCDVAVSIFSTTILEAAAMGVIPLIVNVAGLPHYYPDIAREAAAIEVKDFTAARQALIRLIEDDTDAKRMEGRLEIVAGHYFAKGGAAAAAAIATEIHALADAAR
jgi:hypothetical protein